MSRPVFIEDLTADAQQGHVFMSITNPAKLFDYPGVGAIALGIKAAAEKDGLEYETDYSGITIRTKLTPDELQTRLRQHQEEYDKGKALVEATLAGGEVKDGYYYSGYFRYEDGDGYTFSREQTKLREEAAELTKIVEEAEAYGEYKEATAEEKGTDNA